MEEKALEKEKDKHSKERLAEVRFELCTALPCFAAWRGGRLPAGETRAPEWWRLLSPWPTQVQRELSELQEKLKPLQMRYRWAGVGGWDGHYGAAWCLHGRRAAQPWNPVRCAAYRSA